MKIRALDIGGSGIKTALFTINDRHRLHMVGKVQFFADVDWQNFEKFVQDNIDMQADIIGISSAGFIDSVTGTVQFCSIANWVDKPLKSIITDIFLNPHVYVLNDAEAHLMAHHDSHAHSQICLSLGTSLGFATSDAHGNIMRPADNINFDIGSVTIPTRASNKEVWWALGSHGLQELQQNQGIKNGTKQFGNRLGSFLANMCAFFRPQTVVLSGGITDKYWHVFYDTLMAEFQHATPAWLASPEIVQSPYGKDAGLWGIAKYAWLQRQ